MDTDKQPEEVWQGRFEGPTLGVCLSPRSWGPPGPPPSRWTCSSAQKLSKPVP